MKMQTEKGRQYRAELKFICNEMELRLIEERIKTVMQIDSHAKNGKYDIKSLYFDDDLFSCAFENEIGISQRSKYRIRMYDDNRDFLKLEIKHKKNLLGYKESCLITREEAKEYLTPGIIETKETDPLPKQKYNLLLMKNNLRPKVIVVYERTAYVYPIGNVRITLDRNIAISRDINSFLRDESIALTPIMQKGYHVLEVKYDGFLPDYIASLLEIGSLERSAFSKYYMAVENIV